MEGRATVTLDGHTLEAGWGWCDEDRVRIVLDDSHQEIFVWLNNVIEPKPRLAVSAGRIEVVS